MMNRLPIDCASYHLEKARARWAASAPIRAENARKVRELAKAAEERRRLAERRARAARLAKTMLVAGLAAAAYLVGWSS